MKIGLQEYQHQKRGKAALRKRHLLWRLSGIGGVLLLVLGVQNVLMAQSKADSLTRVLATVRQDTHRVINLVELAWEINEEDTDRAETLLKEASALALQLGYRKGEATALNGMGVVEEIRGNPDKALDFYQKALVLRELLRDEQGVASAYNNIANAYELQGEFDKALLNHRENLRIVELLHDTLRMARAHLNIGGVYEQMGIYPEAYDQINLARAFFEIKNDDVGLARSYTQLGHIRLELDMWKESARWYREALRMKSQMGDEDDIASAYTDLGNALDEMKNKDSTRAAIELYQKALDIRRKQNDEDGIATLFNNFGDAYKHLGDYERALNYLNRALKIRTAQNDQTGLMEVFNGIGDVEYNKGNTAVALRYTEQYYDIAKKIKSEKYIQRAYKDFSKIYAALGDYQKAFDYRVKYDEFRYSRLDESRAKVFEQKEVVFSEGRKQREIEKQQHQLALKDAELGAARTRGLALIGGGITMALLALMLYNRSRLRARTNKQLEQKNRAIERERERADALLKNILPDTIAHELKLHNSVQPVRHESVSVMFTDFKGFTSIAEQVTPEDLISELDECFRLFDSIMDQYGLEKIKTLGDSYMCAAGLPIANDDHARLMIQAAFDMQDGLHKLMQQKIAEGKPEFTMRVGIHSGPVVAGIVGSHKFAYDIWGDTVNTAARMEQGSEPGKINISGATYALVKDHFRCTYRGNIAAKNKGEIAMYFVERG